MAGGPANGGRTSEWREDQLMVGEFANDGCQLMVARSADGWRISYWWEDQLMVGGSANGGRIS
jgi:hypothetical protein